MKSTVTANSIWVHCSECESPCDMIDDVEGCDEGVMDPEELIELMQKYEDYL